MSLLNRGKSTSKHIPSGTPSIHPEQPPSPTIAQPNQVPLPLQPQNPPHGWVVDRHNGSQSCHRRDSHPQPSTCTMSHPYHTHPFPAASRRFLNDLPLPHTRGDATTTTTTTPQKERKGQGDPAVSARRCQGKCILTSCVCNMYLPRLRRRKLALFVASPSFGCFASAGWSSSGPGLTFRFLGQNACVRS